jgi:hypothetical protein
MEKSNQPKMKNEQVKAKGKPRVKKESISLSDLKIAKEIRSKRDALNYKGVRLARW